MPAIVELLRSRRLPHVATLALISFGFAGCSADMSSRMSQTQNSMSNPFASEATGSVPPAPIERREAPQYSRPPASAYSSSALPPAVGTPQSYPSGGGSGGIASGPIANSGISSGGRGVSSYAPPTQPQLETTGAVTPPRSVAAVRPAGGTKVIVGTSDTLDILAHRYHVTSAEILAANGYKGPRALAPGQQIIIPHPGAVASVPPPAAAVSAAPPMVAPKPVAAATAPAASSVHFVNHGETLA